VRIGDDRDGRERGREGERERERKREEINPNLGRKRRRNNAHEYVNTRANTPVRLEAVELFLMTA